MVTPEEDGDAVYGFLKFKKGISRRLIIKLKGYPQGIQINGAHARTVDKLKAGDVLTLCLIDAENDSEETECRVPILYEDEDVIVFNKPPGMPVHQSKNHQKDTLANVFAANCREKGENAVFRVINRLDKDTSGAVVVAKNAYSAAKLTGHVNKSYLAVVSGTITENSGMIDAPIHRPDPHMTLRAVLPEGKPAKTGYEVLSRGEQYTFVRCTLYTGRTHQIRVHMAYKGHPLAGDDMYGGSREMISRQALHCESVSFLRPMDGTCININAPMYKDMEICINYARL